MVFNASVIIMASHTNSKPAGQEAKKMIGNRNPKPEVDVVVLEEWEKPRKSLLDYYLDRVYKDVPERV